LPAAGTVVTEMNTPTRALERPAVSDSVPAVPASSATTKDHRSGFQMNAVSGRGAVSEPGSIQPAARAARAKSAVIAMARAKPSTSSRRPPATSRHSRRARPVATAATAPNSGPTTIAPTTSTEESSTTAMPAIIVARVRKA